MVTCAVSSPLLGRSGCGRCSPRPGTSGPCTGARAAYTPRPGKMVPASTSTLAVGNAQGAAALVAVHDDAGGRGGRPRISRTSSSSPSCSSRRMRVELIGLPCSVTQLQTIVS